MKLKRFWPLVPAAFLALGLALSSQPAAAAPVPLVPNPVTIVNNNDDSSRAFRIHQGGSCTGTYKVLQPGYTSQAFVSDVNSMRFYEDARVAVKYKDGRSITIVNVNVAETAGASKCYPSMTDQRLYEVYSHPLAFSGAGSSANGKLGVVTGAQLAACTSCLNISHSVYSSFEYLRVAVDSAYPCADSRTAKITLPRGTNTLSNYGIQDAGCIYVETGRDAVVYDNGVGTCVQPTGWKRLAEKNGGKTVQQRYEYEPCP